MYTSEWLLAHEGDQDFCHLSFSSALLVGIGVEISLTMCLGL